MAENKKSFVLYTDLFHTVSKLPDDKAGQLFKHILEYVNDLNPVSDDLILNIAFEPIKQQLKRDLKAWEGAIETKSKGGRLGNLKRWNTDLYTKVINDKMTLEEAEEIAKHRTASDTDKKHRIPSDSIASVAVNVNDNVNVTVNDNVIKNTIEERKLKFATSVKEFANVYDKELLTEFYNYWTEHNEGGKKMRFEMQKVFDIKRRLITWHKRSKDFTIKNNAPNTTQTAGLRPLLNQLK